MQRKLQKRNEELSFGESNFRSLPGAYLSCFGKKGTKEPTRGERKGRCRWQVKRPERCAPAGAMQASNRLKGGTWRVAVAAVGERRSRTVGKESTGHRNRSALTAKSFVTFTVILLPTPILSRPPQDPSRPLRVPEELMDRFLYNKQIPI